VFSDVAIGPDGEMLRPDLIPAETGFDRKGRPLQLVSPPEDMLLLRVLRNRTVDHVVRVKGNAPDLSDGAPMQKSTLQPALFG